MSTKSRRAELLDVLAQNARGGDRQAFERLVVETSSQVYALALRLVGNEQDARDIVQESYLRAYRSIDRFRGDSAVTTWLHRITANCASTHLGRKRLLTAQVSEGDTIAEQRVEYLPEEVCGAADDRRRIVRALSMLSSEQRTVVVLHDVYDLSHEVIACELGITRTASKVRLHRARRLLRDVLFVPPEPSEQTVLAPPRGARPVRPVTPELAGTRHHHVEPRPIRSARRQSVGVRVVNPADVEAGHAVSR